MADLAFGPDLTSGDLVFGPDIVSGSPPSPPDTIPSQIRNNVQTSTLVTFDQVSITGITASISGSIENGEYSINSGAFTTSPTTLNNNDTITVRHTSSADESTNTVTTLTYGPKTATFTSRTEGGSGISTSPFFGITIGIGIST